MFLQCARPTRTVSTVPRRASVRVVAAVTTLGCVTATLVTRATDARHVSISVCLLVGVSVFLCLSLFVLVSLSLCLSVCQSGSLSV